MAKWVFFVPSPRTLSWAALLYRRRLGAPSVNKMMTLRWTTCLFLLSKKPKSAFRRNIAVEQRTTCNRASSQTENRYVLSVLGSRSHGEWACMVWNLPQTKESSGLSFLDIAGGDLYLKNFCRASDVRAVSNPWSDILYVGDCRWHQNKSQTRTSHSHSGGNNFEGTSARFVEDVNLNHRYGMKVGRNLEGEPGLHTSSTRNRWTRESIWEWSRLKSD